MEPNPMIAAMYQSQTKGRLTLTNVAGQDVKKDIKIAIGHELKIIIGNQVQAFLIVLRLRRENPKIKNPEILNDFMKGLRNKAFSPKEMGICFKTLLLLPLPKVVSTQKLVKS